MTDLLDRYLAAVSRELPDAQRADIVAELRDEMMTTIEAKEEAAGRPLDRHEMEAVLTEFGHPLRLAGRYRKVQHLVGPEVFPFWWAGLKVTLGVVGAVYLVVAILHVAFADTGPLAADAFPDLASALVTAFGAVTLAAVLIERLNLQHYLYRWRPQQLPPVQMKSTTPFERVAEIGMEVVFLLWWTGVIQFRQWVFPNSVLHVALGSVFDAWFWPILVYSAAELVMNLLGLLRPAWLQVNAALSLLRALAAVGISAGLLQAGTWVVVKTTLTPSLGETVQANFDLGVKVALVVTVASMSVRAAVDARRLWLLTRDSRSGGASGGMARN